MIHKWKCRICGVLRVLRKNGVCPWCLLPNRRDIHCSGDGGSP